MIATTITQKGQVTIPISIRKLLGLTPNQKVIFEVNNQNEVTLKPASSFMDYAGKIKSGKHIKVEDFDTLLNKNLKKDYEKKFHNR